MDDLPWTEKYRPKTLNNFRGNSKIKELFQLFVKEKNIPNLLLHGPAGVGKSSIIHAFLNEYSDTTMTKCNILELNSSDERGIETIRKQIRDFVSTGSFFKDLKFVILDEADNMTETAQLAIRALMDQTKTNVRYVFLCNYLNRIQPSLVSRLIPIRFSFATRIEMVDHCYEILVAENMENHITKSKLSKIIKQFPYKDYRRVINHLYFLTKCKRKYIKMYKNILYQPPIYQKDEFISNPKEVLKRIFYNQHKIDIHHTKP